MGFMAHTLIGQIAIVLLALVVLRIARKAWRFHRAVKRDHDRLASIWASAGPTARAVALEAAFPPARRPPPVWFLLGSARLHESDYAEAARYFGMAYHGDADLASAALLTFACLKTAVAGDDPAMCFVEHVVRTWRELNEPGLLVSAAERSLVRILENDGTPPAELSPLGRIVWLLEGPGSRAILADLADRPPGWAQSLFGSVAQYGIPPT